MTIVWSPTAVEDLEHLRATIEQYNPRAAAKVARAILRRVESLAGFAGTPFIVVYTTVEQTVQIVTVLHTARKWPR